jgi:RNA polymerase sigma-70 factor (ECF subfamily)
MRDGIHHEALQEEFIRRIQRSQLVIHRICAVYAGTAAEREDLWQEILLRLWRAYPGFRGDAEFSTWMYRVALNTALTARRRQAPSGSVPVELLNLPAPRPDGGESRERIDLLYDSIAQLHPLDRAVLLMQLEGRSYAEIAEVTGMSPGSVSVRLVRTRERIRRILIVRGVLKEETHE